MKKKARRKTCHKVHDARMYNMTIDFFEKVVQLENKKTQQPCEA